MKLKNLSKVIALGLVATFAFPFPSARATDVVGCGNIPEWSYFNEDYHGGTSGFPAETQNHVIYSNYNGRHTQNESDGMSDHKFLGFRVHDSCD